LIVRAAFDSNVLVYAEGVDRSANDAGKTGVARALLEAIPRSDRVVAVQVVGEVYNVLVRKGGYSPAEARDAADDWRESSVCVPTTAALLQNALGLAAGHRLGIWDAIVLAAAAEARCDYLFSEDMQHGFVWRGVEVVNPFLADPHPVVAKLLAA
jgi:predicted nucleic acid-binding protein